MTENMKSSGTDYLCEIPASWKATKIKYCAKICNGAEYADIVVDEGGFPVMGSGGEFARASKYCYSGKSVLLGRKGTIDKPLFIEEPFWCVDTMFYTIPSTDIEVKYLYYCSLNIRFDYYVTSTALPSMTQRDLSSEKIAIPNFKEQTLIADFLDKQCARIDGITADIKKQIELLEQYKKSLITETVTKGLDKTVPMKDSGIEWIGEIPEHWEVKRLKLVSKLKTGTTPSGNEGINYNNEGLCWFTPADFKPNMNLITSEKFIDKQSIKSEKIAIYPENSVLLIAIGATVGKTGYTFEDSYSNQQITAIIPIGILGKYLLYYISSKSNYIKENALYTTLPIINNSYLGSISTAIPSKSEQTQIADFLDKKCAEVDAIIETKKQQSKLMKKHKQSIIYEYVTGKKRVREVQG